jgi:dihydroflavonol-4-reductase
MPDVLLTGASGFVGRAILERLLGAGRSVRALTRSDAGAATLRAAGADVAIGDILDAAAIRRAAEGCGVVYHVAGANAFCLPDPASLYRTNVDGTVSVVGAAADAGVRRIVYTSSAATIGEEAGTIGSETSVHRGSFLSHYEESKWQAEQAAFRVAAERGVDLVSVNPASVQGPGRTRGTAKLLIGYLNGTLRALIDSQMSVVDIADCAEAHLLAEEWAMPGERYVISGATLTVREAVELMGRVAGITRSPRVLPPRMAMAMATTIGSAGRLARRRAPFCREMMRTLLHGHAYDGSRATRELGLVYTPLEDTLRRTLAWYQREGIVTRGLPGAGPPAG